MQLWRSGNTDWENWRKSLHSHLTINITIGQVSNSIITEIQATQLLDGNHIMIITGTINHSLRWIICQLKKDLECQNLSTMKPQRTRAGAESLRCLLRLDPIKIFQHGILKKKKGRGGI